MLIKFNKWGFFALNKIEYQLDNFMLYCDSKGLSRKTLGSYEQSLRLFQIYLTNELNITEIKDVKTRHIRQYIKYLRERGKYTVSINENSDKLNYPDRRNDLGNEISDTTIANYVRNIKVFFNFLYTEREILDNPVDKVKNIKPNRKQKEQISPSDLKRFFNAMDITKFHEYRLWTQARLCYDTGIRASECCNLIPSDVDFKFNSILIRNPKNHQERFVYFSRTMSRDLKRWLKHRDRFSDSDYLFPTIRGTKLDIRNFNRSLQTVGKRIGIDIHTHLLRNSFAKSYIMSGGDWSSLSRILGHSSAEVTQKHYLDFSNEEIRVQHNKHSPLDKI